MQSSAPDLAGALTAEPRARVEAFQRRHRVALLSLVFTDIVGSTQIKQSLGDDQATALLRGHHALVRQTLARFPDGEEIERAGDSFFLVFAKPSDALRFALTLQAELRRFSREANRLVTDRVGIHVGEVLIEKRPDGSPGKDLYGLQVDITARVMSLSAGDQVLLTRAAFDHARQVLKGQDLEGLGSLAWMNHGPYALKGVEEPIEVCEVGEEGAAALKPPHDSEKARRFVSADSEAVPGWRPAVGQTVPETKWVLEKRLGEGGFGEVWLGRHVTLKDLRVFKFCFRADRVRSLKREVTIFRVLRERIGDHANIVSVYDVCLDRPPYYLLMDYAAGGDLRGWAAACGGCEHIPLATRLEIVAQAAEALHTAHNAGVLHRDVKPSNILINELGEGRLQVRLTDFGIGQVVSQEALVTITKLGFTQTLAFPTGTQMYMAPELLAGKSASVHSDLYSLGVVLYQLLVGDLARPLTTDWVKSISNPLLRADLEQCFAGEPEERFQSAIQLAEDLRRLPQREAAFHAERAASAAAERRAHRRRLARATVLTLLPLACIGGLAYYAWQQAQKARSAAMLASHSQEQALRETAVAQRNAQESRRRLVRQYAGKGVEDLADGDYLGALPWFAEVLRLERRDPTNAETDRVRLGAVLAQCPTLTEIVLPEAAAVPAQFGPDARWVVTASGGRLAAWDAATGKAVAGNLKITQGVSAFGGSGRQLWVLVRSARPALQVYDPLTGRALTPPLPGAMHGPADGDTVADWVETPTGRRYVAMSCADAAVRVWDPAAGKVISLPTGRRAALCRVTLSPDGQWLATAGGDGVARIWSLPPLWAAPETTAAAFQPTMSVAHDKALTDVAFSRDGSRLVTGSADGTARVWETRTGQAVTPALHHGGTVNQARFSPDMRRVVTASDDGTARVWEADTGVLVPPFLNHGGRVLGAVFSADGEQVLTTGDDATLRLWGLAPRDRVLRWLKAPGRVARALFSPDGQHVATADPRGTLRIWDVTAGQTVVPPVVEAGVVSLLGFSPDGQWLLSQTGAGPLRVWNTQTGNARGAPLAVGGAVSWAVFSPNAKWLVTVAGPETRPALRLWELGSGTSRSLALDTAESPLALAFGANERYLFALFPGEHTRAWEVASAKALLKPVGPVAWVTAPRVSPDRRLIALQTDDRTVRICQAADGKAVAPPLLHRGKVTGVAFSPNSLWVLTVADQAVRVWDALTGEPLTPPLSHPGGVTSAVFRPDGHAVLTTSEDGQARLWPLGAQAGSAEDLAQLAQFLATRRVDDTGTLVPLGGEEQKQLWPMVQAKFPAQFGVVTP